MFPQSESDPTRCCLRCPSQSGAVGSCWCVEIRRLRLRVEKRSADSIKGRPAQTLAKHL